MFMRALGRLSIRTAEPNFDHVSLRNQAVSNAKSTRSRLGLLDLPLELRLMIYRHLLVDPHTLDHFLIAPGYRPFVHLGQVRRFTERL